MRVRTTGSRVHRLWKCPPSVVLPQIEEVDVDKPLADRGKIIHAFLERVRLIGREAALAEVPQEHRLICELLDLEALPVRLAAEVAFLYDVKARTAREIGRSIGRDYDGHLRRTGQAPVGPNEIPCTIDLVGLMKYGADGSDSGYIGDYKSGRTRYPAPDKFGQTLLAALCVLKVYEVRDVVVELIYIRSDGDHFGARRLVDEWDLETFADELERAWDLAAAAELDLEAGRGVAVNEGPHCEYCEAYKNCPAKVALVKSLPSELAALGYTAPVIAGEEPPALGTVAAGGITRARAADAWMVTERLIDILKRIQEEICGMSAFDPIELPDGRVIGRLVTRRELLVGKVANQVIREWFGEEAAREATELKVSKDALREAVVEHVNAAKERGEKLTIQSKKGTGVLDRALAEIKRRGGIEEHVSDNLKPHVPRKKSLPSGEL